MIAGDGKRDCMSDSVGWSFLFLSNLTRGGLTRVALLTSAVALTSMVAFARDTGGGKPTTIIAPGGRIDVFITRDETAVSHQDLIDWASASSKSVSTYFGRYPLAHVELR